MNRLLYKSLLSSSSISSLSSLSSSLPSTLSSSVILRRSMAGGLQHLKKAANAKNDNNNDTNNLITIEAGITTTTTFLHPLLLLILIQQQLKGKKNLTQSEWKLNFLVKLIRGAWVPDALAQLKFSPKHKAVDVSNVVKRATSIAKTFHEIIPEELYVKEVIVTKGQCQKRMRIMGRGRTGFGYKRRSHVLVKVSKIDFDKEINNAKTFSQKKKWLKRLDIVNKLKAKAPEELKINTEIKPSS